MSARAAAADEPSFSEAMDELESVLHRIERDEIDIDQLGKELGRAAELLEVCRKKIRRAAVEVQQIVDVIEEDADADAADVGDAPRASGGATGPARTRPEAPRSPGDGARPSFDPSADDDDIPF